MHHPIDRNTGWNEKYSLNKYCFIPGADGSTSISGVTFGGSETGRIYVQF